MTVEFADVLRVVILGLFGLTIGETLFIFRHYIRLIPSTRRLLPVHIVSISLALLGLEAEAVWQNVERLGDPLTWYIPINLVLFLLTYCSLVSVRVHVSRKGKAHRQIDSLLRDPNGLP